MTKHKHYEKNEEKDLKKHCNCEDCDCDENEEDCQCEDCDCEQTDKASEYLDALMRSQAEFDNYRKRTDAYATKAKEEGIMLAVQKILPVIDSFTAAEKQLTKEEFKKGLNYVKEQLESSLKQLGVSKIEALGENFDPNLHEAIMVVEDESKESQTIVEVLQEGYKLGDRVIRHSVVKINS